MMEAGVVVGADHQPLFWHAPPDRTAGSLPDSRTLWDVMWEHRETMLGFAHTHPGDGVPGPSFTDITTFVAIEKALGRSLTWWIASSDHVVLCRAGSNNRWYTELGPQGWPWLHELRRISYGGR